MSYQRLKVCLRCRKLKAHAAFSKHKLGRLGLHPWCRVCVSEYNALRYIAAKAKRFAATGFER